MKEKSFQTFRQFCEERKRRKRRIALLLAVLTLVTTGSILFVRHVASSADASRPEIAESEQRASAIHEAGHVVVGLVVTGDMPLIQAEVRTRLGGDGLLGRVIWIPRIKAQDVEGLREELARLCGGRAADVLINGAPNEGAHSDLAVMTEEAKRIHFRYGLGPTLATREPLYPLDWGRIEAELQSACRRAEGIVAHNKGLVIELADLIMSRPVTGGARIADSEAIYGHIAESGKFPVEPPGASCVPSLP